MATKKFPATAAELLQCLEQQGQRDAWDVSTQPAESDDTTSTSRVVFTLKPATMASAYVAHEFGDVLVTLDADYWFALNRLHEDYPRWTWQKQVGEKSWCKAVHIQLLDALVALFPPEQYHA